MYVYSRWTGHSFTYFRRNVCTSSSLSSAVSNAFLFYTLQQRHRCLINRILAELIVRWLLVLLILIDDNGRGGGILQVLVRWFEQWMAAYCAVICQSVSTFEITKRCCHVTFVSAENIASSFYYLFIYLFIMKVVHKYTQKHKSYEHTQVINNEINVCNTQTTLGQYQFTNTSSGPIAQISEYRTSNQLSVNATKAVQWQNVTFTLHSKAGCSNQSASMSF